MSRVDRCQVFDVSTPRSFKPVPPVPARHAIFDHVFGEAEPERVSGRSEASTSAGEEESPPALLRHASTPAPAVEPEGVVVRVVGHETREDHTTFTIEVRRPGRRTIQTRRRYKEFDTLRQQVVKVAPSSRSLPRFPLRRRETMSTLVEYVRSAGRDAAAEEAFATERARGLDAWLSAVVAQDPALSTVELCGFLNVPAVRIEDSSRPQADEPRLYHVAFHCQGHVKVVLRRYQAFKQLLVAAEKAGLKGLPRFPGVTSRPQERQQLLQKWLQAVFEASAEQGWRFGPLRRFLELED